LNKDAGDVLCKNLTKQNPCDSNSKFKKDAEKQGMGRGIPCTEQIKNIVDNIEPGALAGVFEVGFSLL
jgi:hypothetical protein